MKKNYKFPLINIIPAMVWSIPLHQKLFPNAGWWVTFGLCALFVVVYVTLSYLPIIVAVPAVASVIIFTGLFWVFADYIGNQVVSIIAKVLIVVFFGVMELAISANATVSWLEGKEANKPRIRVEK
ncbi:MAG: hypothetical protein ACK5M3_11800 [Dysgonomonas sp.]